MITWFDILLFLNAIHRTIYICMSILLAYQVLLIQILMTLTSCQEEELGFEIHCSPHGV